MHFRKTAEQEMAERLSGHDRAALFEMRREIWKGGFQGGAAGFLAGVAGFKVLEQFPQIIKQYKLERKHKFATPLLTGAFGMLVGSTTSARNCSHTLHYILHKHATPRKSNYQEMVDSSRQNFVAGKSLDPSPLVAHYMDDNYNASVKVFDGPKSQHFTELWKDTIAEECGHPKPGSHNL